MADERPGRKLLLVEGIDDKYVVEGLCKRRDFALDFDIVDSGGFRNSRKKYGYKLRSMDGNP